MTYHRIAQHFMHTNCCGCFYEGTADNDDDDDNISLLSVGSQELVGCRMVSTPLRGHPAAIDISDVISSIHGTVGTWHLLHRLWYFDGGGQATHTAVTVFLTHHVSMEAACCQWSGTALLYSSTAIRAVPQDCILRTSFPLHCTYHLELSAEHCDTY